MIQPIWNKTKHLSLNGTNSTSTKYFSEYIHLYAEKLFISIFTIVLFNLGKTVSLWEFLIVKILKFRRMIWNFSINYSKICYELCWSFISLLWSLVFFLTKILSDTFFPKLKNTIVKIDIKGFSVYIYIFGWSWICSMQPKVFCFDSNWLNQTNNFVKLMKFYLILLKISVYCTSWFG